jgi:hypothetical protein
MRGDVVVRQEPGSAAGATNARCLAGGGGDKQVAAAPHGGDGPGVAVGDVQVAVVAPGDHPVPHADRLPCAAGDGADVVDPAFGDQLFADCVAELRGLLAGVDHHHQLLAGREGGGGEAGDGVVHGGLVGMQPDGCASLKWPHLEPE